VYIHAHSGTIGVLKTKERAEMNQVSRKTLIKKTKPAPAAPKFGKVRANVSFAPDAIVTLLVDKNPKKEGNKNWPWFQAIMDAVAAGGGKCTVAEAVAAGSHMGELRYDVEHKFIKVEPAAKSSEA
jgi:hypothetical protein